MNLAVNAHDAMPNGGTLTIGVDECWMGPDYLEHHPDARIGHFVRLQITDTGCGMSPKIRARIFEPFFTTKEPAKAPAWVWPPFLALSNSMQAGLKSPAKWHAAPRSPFFSPPVTDIRRGRKRNRCRRRRAAAGGSETILVVEDEVVLREMARDFLTDCGYRDSGGRFRPRSLAGLGRTPGGN